MRCLETEKGSRSAWTLRSNYLFFISKKKNSKTLENSHCPMASSSPSSSHDPFSPPPATLSSGAGDEPSSSPPRIDFQHADERDADDFIAAAGATPLRVAAVAIKGLQRTSRPIVERELSNLREARTLDEVKAVLLSDWESLQTLGIFSAVELVLDECSPVRERREKVLFFSLFPLIDGAWRSTSLLTTSTFSLEKTQKKLIASPSPAPAASSPPLPSGPDFL